MWTLTATAHTRAAASHVWAIYCDVANWPRWDHGMAFYRPDGPFAAGTAGSLQAVGGQSCPLLSPTLKKGTALMIVLPLDQTMPSSLAMN
ncbi:MAG TPA: hypothetical protein VH593_19370 [Ktedonobacteraceae bacterium]